MFGRVTEGMDVIDKIAAVETGRRRGFDDVPVEPVIMTERAPQADQITLTRPDGAQHLRPPRAARSLWLMLLRRALGPVGAALALDRSALQRLHGARGRSPPGSSRDRAYVSRHTWVDLAHISPNLPLAVVASEDQKFPEHWGFDVEAIEKAYELNQHSHRVRGASTISQQVAKNLYLWSGRSYFRKGLEAYFTVLIESLLAEAAHPGDLPQYRRIRLRHLRRRGGRPALFPQPASRLSRSDAAVLAAVLPNPEHYSAPRPRAMSCSGATGS